MRQAYTTGLVVLTMALLLLACVLFALAQGGQSP
ncbi:MAG: Sulfate permease [uncultured Rubrobacteraceae bacterium]|uniref:Sulfate permease n=1 Tax=uncultured Rubrobacteraceae bacterium TaxID=349277 RepID=A0A6J4QJZ0_9ACTN|nr:MAG: Sulfate permease [uncultured Rubrobacteraceae bacterium]